MSLPLNHIDNRFTTQLPKDTSSDNYCRTVERAAFSFVSPKQTSAPELLLLNNALAESLFIETQDHEHLAKLLTGNDLPEALMPYAMNYGGHQFGHWAGQLGDGRAINLVQLRDKDDALITLQLKGAGPTPYSRNADGLAVLRSSIREFLCSEAMYHLGIATTRALSLSLTGDKVTRDMFYDGHPKLELGAIVCRTSTSFMRFGSFQLPASRGDLTLLKQLVDYSITQDFPHLGEPNADVYLQWFSEICQRTCLLMVNWMRVGFVHGVMNTDNMSIIGETIDFGPYGWIDEFDLNWTPNTTDAQGKRYRFGAQPQIAQWNLFQLANAIYPLINEADGLNTQLSEFATNYERQWLEMMADKTGLVIKNQQADAALLEALETVLQETPTDMTIFYRLLASLPELSNEWQNHLAPAFYQDFTSAHWQVLNEWLVQYVSRLNQEQTSASQRKAMMNKVNPKYVLRNFLSQQAIKAAEQGQFDKLQTLYQLIQQPYDEQPEFEQEYFVKRPEWAKNKPGCSMLSCSS
ncbi:protein adenylyltransferase SelO [Thalassotalea marina]|uniref:Protein nucleotidyltransferase YdiU n=1 Tax=Thalassotalea marina TaxID=1673741 RepID=A0A919EIB8_9GAMM|nr:YdiU family protein [Thalassotalea marina]GHF83912.1 UPF0061 protein [Thalassotalea marina]